LVPAGRRTQYGAAVDRRARAVSSRRVAGAFLYRARVNDALLIVGAVLVAVGLAGIIVPALPGVPLVFAGLILAASADGFQKVGVVTLVVLGLLTALSFVVDFAAAALGAKKMGASKWALLGSALGVFVGLFFGLPGLLLGPFVGAVVAELVTRRDWKQAGRSGVGAWIGFLLGAIGKLTLAFAMLGIFLAAWLL
jgi:uncharacterized protein